MMYRIYFLYSLKQAEVNSDIALYSDSESDPSNRFGQDMEVDNVEGQVESQDAMHAGHLDIDAALQIVNVGK